MSEPVRPPRLLAGRYRSDSAVESASGEAFREDVLIPALAAHKSAEPLLVDLTKCLGIPASWAEEAFGGLVRRLGPSVLGRVEIQDDLGREKDAKRFMSAAAQR